MKRIELLKHLNEHGCVFFARSEQGRQPEGRPLSPQELEHIAVQARETAEALVKRHEQESRRVGIGGQVGIGPKTGTERLAGGETLEGRVKVGWLF